jgi:diacylglycerol kinase (ATP)
MKSRSLLDSFRFAMEGLVYALQSHRHMQYMLLLSAATLLAAEILGTDRVGIIALILATGMLIMAELINAALEATVDLACSTYHPLAKVAKDIGAAAVMIASGIAVFISALVLLETPRITKLLGMTGDKVAPSPLHFALVGAVLVVILVVLGKVWGKKGTLWKGGAVSGHSALAAYLLTAIVYKTNSPLIFGMAFLLAFLVAQSRYEGGIHSLREVLLGALVGLTVSGVMLRLLV